MDGTNTRNAGSGTDRAYLRSTLACQPTAQSLIEVLRQAAAEAPNALYVNLLDSQNKSHELTFSQVLWGAERWARWFAGKIGARGARVALLLPTSADFIQAFFGAQIAGAIPVPLAFPLSLGNAEPYVTSLARIIASARPALLVTVPHLAEAAKKLFATAEAGEVVLPEQVTDTKVDISFPDLGLDDIALIQYASGRVHEPSGALLSHRNVLANVFGLGTALRLSASDVALTWVPLVHDMGLIGGLFTSLYWRCPLHVMPPQTFLMHPSLWLKNISQFKVTLAAAPNAGYQLCVRRVQDRHLKDLDLSSWRLALNGAETVHPSTVEAFCARFASVGFNRRAICPVYGLAENTLATACPEVTAAYQVETLGDAGPVVSLGMPLAGQELAVVGADNTILAERSVGEVVVRGACVMAGYYNDAAATRRAIDAQGWLHTGDLGFISAGRLFLTGRVKDMVIKMGRNYYPSDVEDLLARFPGISGATLAFARPNVAEGTEDLVLLVENTPLAPEAVKQLGIEINAELLAKLGLRADNIVYVAPDSLANRNEQGGRAHVQRRFLEGTLT